MNIYIVTEDLGDGDVGLRYFSSKEKAVEYMERHEDWCYYESNPRCLNLDNLETFQFNDGE